MYKNAKNEVLPTSNTSQELAVVDAKMSKDHDQNSNAKNLNQQEEAIKIKNEEVVPQEASELNVWLAAYYDLINLTGAMMVMVQKHCFKWIISTYVDLY